MQIRSSIQRTQPKLLTLNRLNLKSATHVHIVEPHWNPQVEAQAAARVDRLDQDQDVFVHRYIVKDSIEEVLHSRAAIMDSRDTKLNKLIKARQRHKIQIANFSVSASSEEENVDMLDTFKVNTLLILA